MDIKKLQNWFSMPVLNFWTWQIWWTTKKDLIDIEKQIEIIKYSLANWICWIDTAEIYWMWWAEEIIWEAIKDYDRNKIFLASKVMWNNCSYNAIIKACKNSLKRTKQKYFDLYYIHWREEKFPLEESMKAMSELVDMWLIKNIWVSNFWKKTLIEAQKYTNYKIVANQVHYNLIYREVEKDWLLDYCKENDIMLVAYRPLELWKLANSWNLSHMWLIEKYNKKASQISLNRLIKQKNVVTVFKSLNKEHIIDNLWSIWRNLDEQDVKYLRESYKWQLYKSDCIELW